MNQLDPDEVPRLRIGLLQPFCRKRHRVIPATNDPLRSKCRVRLLEACLVLVVVSAGYSATELLSNAAPAASGPAQDNPGAAILDLCPVEMTGTRTGWRVRYPGADGQLATPDDVLLAGDVHVPQDANIVLKLHSSDYVYILAIPELGLKEAAVPGLEFRLEFRPCHAGRFALKGDQLCGEPDPHPELQRKLIVEPRDRFLAWLNGQSPKNFSSGPP